MIPLRFRPSSDLNEEDYTDEDIIDRLREDYDLCVEADWENVKSILESKRFQYYKVSVESGYYEGFYISIDREYSYLDNYQEKLDMQKELTTLKELLIKCINECGIRVCYPWWATSWEEKIEDSVKVLNEKVKEERDYIKHIPTDRQVARMSSEERKARIGWTW